MQVNNKIQVTSKGLTVRYYTGWVPTGNKKITDHRLFATYIFQAAHAQLPNINLLQ